MTQPHCVTCGKIHDGEFCDCQVIPVMTHQSTFASVDTEILRRALAAAEDAREWASELLAVHDLTLGRTTRKNRLWAKQLEASVRASMVAIKELREVLGFDWSETT
jgi:hypothetical protein